MPTSSEAVVLLDALFNNLEDLVLPRLMMTAIRPHITGEKTITSWTD